MKHTEELLTRDQLAVRVYDKKMRKKNWKVQNNSITSINKTNTWYRYSQILGLIAGGCVSIDISWQATTATLNITVTVVLI